MVGIITKQPLESLLVLSLHWQCFQFNFGKSVSAISTIGGSFNNTLPVTQTMA